jgi:hypothetical protein
MTVSTPLRSVSGRVWLKRIIVGAAIVAITSQWVNTRASILLVNQNPAHPMILATYMYFHSMATGLREGRIGQVDLAAIRRYQSLGNLAAVYERLPREARHEWVNFYTLDVGYSFVVEAARLVFPSLPDNHLRALMLQFVADAALVLFLFFVFSHWNLWLGLLAAYLYSANGPFYDLMSFAYYYYWDIPLTFFVLGSLILVHHRPTEATLWLTLTGLALGFGVWLRGSWWPLSLFLFVAAAMSPLLRKKLLIPVIAFAIIATPQVVRSSRARGRLTLTTRAVWHVALVGLGYYPNPYGLEVNDGVVFKLTKDKYGVEFSSQDYWVHDQAAKREFLSIWQKDRDFVIRSFFGRLKESMAGSTRTSVQSFLSVSNGTYRIACLLGCIAMILRGAEKRLLGIAAAGTYAIYVALTCVFYFVGLAYDNVPEATLLILFMGGLEAALHGTQRIVSRMHPFHCETLVEEADAFPWGV